MQDIEPTRTSEELQSTPIVTPAVPASGSDQIEDERAIPSVLPQQITPGSTQILPQQIQPLDQQSIYPTAQSTQEHMQKQKNIDDYSLNTSEKLPFSGLLVGVIGIIASIYQGYMLIRIVFFSAILQTNLFGLIGQGSGWSLWLLSAISFLQIFLTGYASYKVLKGSVVGLAFLTGLSFMYASSAVYSIQFLVEYGSNITTGSINFYAPIILYPVFFIALIWCWLTPRKTVTSFS